MKIQTEYIGFKNCWTISSSYDFQLHQHHSQTRGFPQTALLRFEVLLDMSPALSGLLSVLSDMLPALPGFSPALPGAPWCIQVLSGITMSSQTAHNQCHGTAGPGIRDPRYSEGRPKCPPKVWYSPDIETSKFTLDILSDTSGGSQWLKYILLMKLTLIDWSY